MSNISLEGSIRTCKVDTAWASRMESDRFLNPSLMVCPPWNGMDNAGRNVCVDSYVTKTAGCNSALDRVAVENAQRPQYIEYVNLDAQGIMGDLYSSNNMYQEDAELRSQSLRNVNNITGNFGLDFGADIYPTCSSTPYVDAMQASNQMGRNRQMQYEAYRSSESKRNAGNFQNCGCGPRY